MAIFPSPKMNHLVQIILLLSIIFQLIFEQAASDECVLDLSNIPSSLNDSNGNWDGFLNKSSCAQPFEQYLFGLAKKSNKTGEIFLNIKEQKDCSTKNDVFTCGLNRLTSGNGGCSDYTVNDVVSEQGNALRSLDEGCRNLGLTGEPADQECISCLRRWKWMVGWSSNNASIKEEVDICKFSVLVSLTSRRISDLAWMNSIYKCLGNGTPIGK